MNVHTTEIFFFFLSFPESISIIKSGCTENFFAFY